MAGISTSTIDDKDSGGIDINAGGAVTIDAAGVSIDSTGVAANLTVASDGAGEDLTIALTGATDSSIHINSSGTAADALTISTSAGGIDITVAGAGAGEDLDITSNSSVNITSSENVADAVVINASAGGVDITAAGAAGEDIDIANTAGSVNISAGEADASAIKLNASAGSINIDSADNITVDAVDDISITTTSADGLITIHSAHTAGQAVLIDANAASGAILDIDAGIVDIDVQGNVTIDADALKLGNAAAGPGVLHIMEDTDNGANFSGFTVGNMTEDAVYTLPTADGSDGQVLKTNGSTVLDWVTISGGTADSIAADNIATGDAAVSLATSSGAITIDSNASTVSVDGHTGVSIISSSSGEVDITSAANIDINATTGIAVDATTVSIDGTDDSNLTITGSAKDLDIAVAGGGTQELRLASAGTGASAIHLNASAGGINIDSADNITIDASDDIAITSGTADGLITIHSAHTAGQAILIDANANAGSILDVDAGILDIDVQAEATIDSVGMAITAGSGTLELTTTGAIDINGDAVTIDSTDDMTITMTSSGAGEDLTIQQVGGNDSSIHILAAGTGTDAIKIDATAGDMLIAPTLANGKTLKIGPTSATEMVFTPSGTASSEKISLTNTSGTADDAILIDSVAGGLKLAAGNDSLHLDADGTDADALNMDSAGGIDIDAAGLVAIDSVGLSIDSAGVAANITSTTDGAGEDFTISLAGATDSSLILSSTGTAADALQISTSAGGMDITVAGAAAGEDLDILSNSSINVTATENAANTIVLHANGGTSETIKIHSDQGTSVTEGAASVSLLSDAGGVELRSTADLANAINITNDGGTSGTITIFNDQGTSVTEGAASIALVSDAGGVELRSTANLANAINLTNDGGTSGTITVFNDQGTSVTEGAASIQLLTDAGGIGIKSTANLANAVLITVDGGVNETIKIHADQSTVDGSAGAGAIQFTTDAGGISLNAAADKDIFAEAGRVILTANENAADCILLHGDAGTGQTIRLLNDAGTNVAAIGLTSTAGGITLTTGATTAVNGLTVTASQTTKKAMVLTADGVTTGKGLEISTDALTTGKSVEIKSTSNNLNGAKLLDLEADGTSTDDYTIMRIKKTASNASDSNAIIGLDIDFNATAGTAARAFRIVSAQTDGKVFELDGDAVTTGKVMTISADAVTDGKVLTINADALEDGKVIDISSNSSDTSPRALLNVEAKHASASGVVPAYFGNASTNANGAPIAQFNGIADGIRIMSKQVIIASPSGATTKQIDGFFNIDGGNIIILGLTLKVTTVIPGSRFIQKVGTGGDDDIFGTFANATALGNLNTIQKMTPKVFFGQTGNENLVLTFSGDPGATSGVVRATLFYFQQIAA